MPSEVSEWRAALEALPSLPDDGEKLRDASLRFLDNDWLGVAMAAGWDALQLWGCFPAARIDVVKRRGDCLGLVPALILGSGCSIEHIDRHCVTITRKRTGARLRHRRERPGRQYACLWWEAPFATGGPDQ